MKNTSTVGQTGKVLGLLTVRPRPEQIKPSHSVNVEGAEPLRTTAPVPSHSVNVEGAEPLRITAPVSIFDRCQDDEVQLILNNIYGESQDMLYVLNFAKTSKKATAAVIVFCNSQFPTPIKRPFTCLDDIMNNKNVLKKIADKLDSDCRQKKEALSQEWLTFNDWLPKFIESGVRSMSYGSSVQRKDLEPLIKQLEQATKPNQKTKTLKELIRLAPYDSYWRFCYVKERYNQVSHRLTSDIATKLYRHVTLYLKSPVTIDDAGDNDEDKILKINSLLIAYQLRAELASKLPDKEATARSHFDDYKAFFESNKSMLPNDTKRKLEAYFKYSKLILLNVEHLSLSD